MCLCYYCAYVFKKYVVSSCIKNRTPSEDGAAVLATYLIQHAFSYQFLVNTCECAELNYRYELKLLFFKYHTHGLKHVLCSPGFTTGNVFNIPGINNGSWWYVLFN